MRTFRDNLFYLLSLSSFICWIPNLIFVMKICGISHPIILREIVYLVSLVVVFFCYARKTFDDISSSPFNGRADVSKGDAIVMRFIGPYLLIIAQLLLTLGLLVSTYENGMSDVKPREVCEWRRRKF